MSLSHDRYLMEHWKFNADQRLKTFNFFVAFSVFANGGVCTAVDHHVQPAVLVLLGGFIVILSTVFAMVDTRCRRLLRLIKQGLQTYEQQLPPASRLFDLDRAQRRSPLRFTVAFNALFALQGLFGLAVVGWGGWQCLGWLRG